MSMLEIIRYTCLVMSPNDIMAEYDVNGDRPACWFVVLLYIARRLYYFVFARSVFMHITSRMHNY
jgi:hypothetical protein